MLEGVSINQQGRPETPSPPSRPPRSRARQGRALQRLLNLNIARSYYAAENYPRAIQVYAAVSRGSEYWPAGPVRARLVPLPHRRLDGSLGA